MTQRIGEESVTKIKKQENRDSKEVDKVSHENQIIGKT